MVQYVDRILRTHPTKTSVEVHDYVDIQLGVLTAMWRNRARSYSQLGFTTKPAARTQPGQLDLTQPANNR